MATLASLVVKILGDTAGLEAAVNNAGNALDRLGTKGSTANKVLKATAIGGAGALATGLISSVNAAASFEHAVDQVGAVAQATDKQMQGLSDTALRIGKDTAFSATEMAGAMEILAANGVSVEDIMNGAADATAALAAAGGTNLAMAADTASTAMAVWNLKAKDMTDLVNRLAGAANVSRFGVEDMSQAIAMGGGAAASAGVEYEDFLAAIAATASSFSSGSDAGTSFKQFLNGLTPNSTKAAKEMTRLGLRTKEGNVAFFDAQGKLKSMAEITDLLSKATANLSEEEKAMALETIFGSDAIRMAAGLAKINGEEFTKMSNAMRDSDAAEIAAARMGNFKGSMEQLKGTIEVLQIQLGQVLLPVLTSVALFFAQHPKVLIAFAGIITGVVVLAIAAWTVVTIAHTAALIAQGAAMIIAFAPLIALIATIALVVAAVYLLIKNWDAVSAAATRFGNAVKDQVLGALQSVLDWLGSNWPMVATLISGPFAPLVALATDAFGIRSALEEAIRAILRAFKKLGEIKINIKTRNFGPLGELPTGIGVTLPSYATGTSFVPATGLALLHRGEAVIPASQNRGNARSRSSAVAGGITIRGNVIVNNNGVDQDADGALKSLGYMIRAHARSRGAALAV